MLNFWFHSKLPFNFGWDVLLFHKLREFHDGISFFEFKINLDRYDPDEYSKFIDKPRFHFHLVLLNYTIIELEIVKLIKR